MLQDEKLILRNTLLQRAASSNSSADNGNASVKIPTVLCGSGVHMKDRKVTSWQIKAFAKQEQLPYCGVSVKNPSSVEQPFAHLSQLVLPFQSHSSEG